MSIRWTRQTLQLAYRLGRIDRQTFEGLLKEVERREEQEQRQAAAAIRRAGESLKQAHGRGPGEP